jgi:hypothetical protein
MSASPRCFACRGPFHPASGHVFTPEICYCGPCYRHFMAWFRSHTHRRSSGACFYTEALTSIRPGIYPAPAVVSRSGGAETGDVADLRPAHGLVHVEPLAHR